MNKFKRFLGNEKNHKFLIPAIAVILGFLLGTLIILLTGKNPSIFFQSILKGTLGIDIEKIGTEKWFILRRFGEYFVYAMPIILTGLSVAFAFRTGLFNIGAEGQLIMGAFSATWLGIMLDLPMIIHLPIVVLGGALAGAIWGFIPGYLKAKFNIHEVVVTIMLNYIAWRFSNYFINNIEGTVNNKTVDLNPGALLKSDFLKGISGNSRLHFGFVIVIIAVFIFWFIINKTTFGYELKAVGHNPHAAEYAGMKVKRNAALSMAISGAFSGLAGVIIVSGTFGYGRVLSGFENYGFDGIAVALIGGNTALGSLFSGLLLGALKAAQPIMQSDGIPNSITIIITASIIVFVAMQSSIKSFLEKFKGVK